MHVTAGHFELANTSGLSFAADWSLSTASPSTLKTCQSNQYFIERNIMQPIPIGTVVVYSEHYLREHCTAASSKDWDVEGIVEDFGEHGSSGLPWVRWAGANHCRSIHPMNIAPKGQRPSKSFDKLRLDAISRELLALEARQNELAQQSVAIVRADFDEAKADKDGDRMHELIGMLPETVEKVFLMDERRQALIDTM